jgi:hypothetical protein
MAPKRGERPAAQVAQSERPELRIRRPAVERQLMSNDTCSLLRPARVQVHVGEVHRVKVLTGSLFDLDNRADALRGSTRQDLQCRPEHRVRGAWTQFVLTSMLLTIAQERGA